MWSPASMHDESSLGPRTKACTRGMSFWRAKRARTEGGGKAERQVGSENERRFRGELPAR